VRTAFRPAVTASTFGVGNPGVSLLEDAFAVTLVATSILWPWLAVLLLVLLAIVVVTGSLWAVRKGLAFSRWTRGRVAPRQVTAS
jgi:hypothetical protein